jgi:hypothetical protein
MLRVLSKALWYVIARLLVILAFVVALVAIKWTLDNLELATQIADDKRTRIVDLSKFTQEQIDLNAIGEAQFVCLFPPDSGVIGQISRSIPGYALDRTSELSASWSIASIEPQQRTVRFTYLTGVQFYGFDSGKDVPCGRKLALINMTRAQDERRMRDQDAAGVEFWLKSMGELRCAMSNKTTTIQEIALGACL